MAPRKNDIKLITIQTIFAIVGIIFSFLTLLFSLFRTKELVSWDLLAGIASIIAAFVFIVLFYFFIRWREKTIKTIFVSYIDEDKEIALKFERDFKREGYKVLDVNSTINVGENIDGKIEESLNQAKIFVIFISDKTAKSQWINKELSHAINTKMMILPIVTAENAEIPSQIANLRFASMTNSYENVYQEIKKAIKTVKLEVPSG